MRYILAETADTAEQVIRRIRDEKIGVGYDTETYGRNLKKYTPILDHRVVCFSFSGVAADGPWKACIDGDLFGMFRSVLEDPDIRKFDANSKFEMHIAKNHHMTYRGGLIDCNLASATLDAHERQHSVEAAGMRNLGTSKRKFKEVVPDFDTERAWIMDRDDFALYSADDAMHERELGIRLMERLQQREWVANKSMYEYYKKYQSPFTLVLAEMEQYGVLVDKGYFEAALERGISLRSRTLYDVVKSLGWLPSRVETFLNSPQQLAEELYEKRKLRVVKNAEGGVCSMCGTTVTKKTPGQRCPAHPYADLAPTPSTDDEALSRIMADDPICKSILQYRKYDRKVKEIAEILDSIHPITGRVHTTFKQDSARTGRLSSVAPNLQNKTESAKEAAVAARYGMETFDIRHGFIADAEAGYCWGAWDQSQLEYRVLAHYCRDKSLIDGFMNDEDFHSVTAKAVYRLPCTVKEVKELYPALRSKAKNGNFCLNYGGGAKKLAFMSNITVEEAREFMDLRERNLPGVYRWWEEQKQQTRNLGFITDLIGWRRDVPDINSDDDKLQGYSERVAINSPIQGTAAQIVKISQLKLMGPTPEWQSRLSEKFRSTGTRMLLQIHDEIDCEVPQDNFRVAGDCIKYAFENPLNFKLAVPLRADEGCGTTWSEAK